MDISIFLARIMGLVFVIVGLATFFKREYVREVIKDFIDHSGLMFVSSTFNIILGLLIVLNHNIWELSWKGLITVLGYLILIRGLLHMFVPEWVKRVGRNFLQRDAFVYSGVISFVIGLYLLYHGFLEHISKLTSHSPF